MDPILTELQQAAAGLYFRSESDYPFETVDMGRAELSVETGSAVSGTLHVDLKRNGQTQRVSFPLVVRE